MERLAKNNMRLVEEKEKKESKLLGRLGLIIGGGLLVLAIANSYSRSKEASKAPTDWKDEQEESIFSPISSFSYIKLIIFTVVFMCLLTAFKRVYSNQTRVAHTPSKFVEQISKKQYKK